MTAPLKTIAGIPVTGTIPTRYKGKRPAQLSIEKFLDALDEVFAFPEVEAVRWSQYTPSFNDGDPCVFTTGEFYVKLVDGPEDGGDNEDGFLGEYCIDQGQYHPIAAAINEAFDYKAVEAYYDALEDAFGDPAEITATREGFHVEDYEPGY